MFILDFERMVSGEQVQVHDGSIVTSVCGWPWGVMVIWKYGASGLGAKFVLCSCEAFWGRVLKPCSVAGSDGASIKCEYVTTQLWIYGCAWSSKCRSVLLLNVDVEACLGSDSFSTVDEEGDFKGNVYCDCEEIGGGVLWS